MPARSPIVDGPAVDRARELGILIRAQRKQLGVSAVATAEAAGLSRVTLHRIETGEPSVSIAAWMAVLDALGLRMDLREASARNRVRPGHSAVAKHQPKRGKSGALPTSIRLADFPQLKRLSWHLQDTHVLTPRQAFDLYERNWRHADQSAMAADERALVTLLARAFGSTRIHV